MAVNLKDKVKEIAAEIAESPDDIKFVESGADLVIPDTTSMDPGSVASGKDKGREASGPQDGDDFEGPEIRIPPGRDEDPVDGPEGDGPDLPTDDPDAPPIRVEPVGRDKDKDSDKEKPSGKYGGKGKGKKGGEPSDDEGEGEGEGEGEEEEEGGKEKGGKGKKKGKKGEGDQDSDGEDEDGDEDKEGDGDDSESDDEKKRALKKGDKVIIKPKSLPGVVTEVNDDGTYKVKELDPAELTDLAQGLIARDGGVFSQGGQTEDVPVHLFKVGGNIPAPSPEYVRTKGELTLEQEIKGVKQEFWKIKDDNYIISIEDGKESVTPWKGIYFKFANKKLANGGTAGTADVEDDYQEDELELIQKPGKKKSKAPPPPTPPPPPPSGPQIDIDPLLERLDLLRNRKFKLPALGREMFLSELDPNSIFYKYQAPLALHNRLAKSAFNKSKPTPDAELKTFYEFITEFPTFILFCTDVLEFRNGGYFLIPDQSFNIILGPGFAIEASVNEVEDMLMSRNPQQVLIAEIVLNFLEKQFVIDYQYYRILSLTPFIKPEFFSDNWIKPHLDYLFNYFRINELGLVSVGYNTVSTSPFTTTKLDDDTIYRMTQAGGGVSEGLNLYNILRETIKDEYKIYVFEGMMAATNSGTRVKSSIFFEKNLGSETNITESIAKSLMDFYQFSITLKTSYDYKEIALFNLQKLSNLQKESYETLLRDIDAQISIYGF